MAMTFKTNLLPDQNLVRELGSSTQKWKINGVTDPKLTDTITTVTTSGSGNAITAISASNGAITATKETTFLTSHQDISGKVDKSGDTMTGSLYINVTTDTSGTTDTGPLVIGNKAGENIAIDSNKIMARKNKVASILHINHDGGLVQIGSGGLKVTGSTTISGEDGMNTRLYLQDNYISTDAKMMLCYGNDSDSSVAGRHGLFSYGYGTKDNFTSDQIWMLYRKAVDGSVILNGTASENVAKSGDTMSGNLTVANTVPEVIVKSTKSNIATSISASSDGKSHGVWSYGYSSNGTSLTSDGKWMIYRDGDGNIIVNGKSTENVLKSGDTMTGNLIRQGSGTIRYIFNQTGVTKGTAPANTRQSQIIFNASGTNGDLSAGYKLAGIENSVNTNNLNKLSLSILPPTSGSKTQKSLYLQCDNSGNYSAGCQMDLTITGGIIFDKTGVIPIKMGPYGGNYGTTGQADIWYCGTNATSTSYVKDTVYIGNTGNQNLKAATLYANILQVNTGTNPDGNTQGHGVKIWHDAEGGNIGIYAGKTNQTDNYYYEIDAPSGYLRVVALKNGSYLSTPCYISPTQGLFGAVWNDYAEFRKDNEKEKDIQQPGKCIKENGDGTLSLTTRRLERGCEIISDTFGFSIGQDKENGCNTPIASSGRVLAYPYESIEEFANHIGWPVCSGPDGTVSIMTEEEEERYPSRIIGTISEIPSYEEWGTGKVKVNGRIWIRIK